MHESRFRPRHKASAAAGDDGAPLRVDTLLAGAGCLLVSMGLAAALWLTTTTFLPMPELPELPELPAAPAQQQGLACAIFSGYVVMAPAHDCPTPFCLVLEVGSFALARDRACCAVLRCAVLC